MQHLRTSYPVALKVYDCDACVWLQENLPHIDAGLEISELRSIVKARRNGWRIVPGQKYIKVISIYAGELMVFRGIPEIDQLCHKYDLYPDE